MWGPMGTPPHGRQVPACASRLSMSVPYAQYVANADGLGATGPEVGPAPCVAANAATTTCAAAEPALPATPCSVVLALDKRVEMLASAAEENLRMCKHNATVEDEIAAWVFEQAEPIILEGSKRGECRFTIDLTGPRYHICSARAAHKKWRSSKNVYDQDVFLAALMARLRDLFWPHFEVQVDPTAHTVTLAIKEQPY